MKIRLSGKGMKKINGYGHGDHYVTYKIKIPKTLNEKQHALVLAYAEMEEDTPGQIMGLTQKKDGKLYIFCNEYYSRTVLSFKIINLF